MTIERDKYIKIPTVLIVAILPIIITIFVAYGTTKTINAAQFRQVEVNTKRLDAVEQTKVDKEVFNMIIDDLKEIKDNQKAITEKLDKHMLVDKQ